MTPEDFIFWLVEQNKKQYRSYTEGNKMEIKHKDNSIFLVFKDEFDADVYDRMHHELWEKLGIRLQPVCWGGYMNAFELVKAV